MQSVRSAIPENDIFRCRANQPGERLFESPWDIAEALCRQMKRGSLPGNRFLSFTSCNRWQRSLVSTVEPGRALERAEVFYIFFSFLLHITSADRLRGRGWRGLRIEDRR